jgi:hypothetical protein
MQSDDVTLGSLRGYFFLNIHPRFIRKLIWPQKIFIVIDDIMQ